MASVVDSGAVTCVLQAMVAFQSNVALQTAACQCIAAIAASQGVHSSFILLRNIIIIIAIFSDHQQFLIDQDALALVVHAFRTWPENADIQLWAMELIQRLTIDSWP